VLIIPDDGSRTLEFKLSYWALRWSVVAGVLALALVVSGGFAHWRSLHWEGVSATLQRDNGRLRSQVDRIDELSELIARMKLVDQQLRGMLASQVDLPPAAYSQVQSEREVVRADGVEMVATVTGRRVSYVAGSPDSRYVPTTWPVSRSLGWVTAEFDAGAGVIRNRHLGIDIACAEKTSIRATADGRVTFAGLDNVLGQLVVVDHDNAYMTRYGHNSALLVKENELVRRGQVIALVGNSGKSSGPHLHYEVWENGQAHDPRRFLTE